MTDALRFFCVGVLIAAVVALFFITHAKPKPAPVPPGMVRVMLASL